MSKILLIHSLLLAFRFFAVGQQRSQQAICVGFYNMENFYDTIDDPKTQDEDFLPNSPYHYNTEVYKDKLSHLSEVVSELGKDASANGVVLLGVSEIENDRVLHDLVSQPVLDSFHFKFVHYDSPDDRGIDVALLYNPKYFKVLHSEPLLVSLYNADGTPKNTRDILWVYGQLEGEPIHVFVNHWPSRRGGEEASAPYRAIAAGICKHVTDSLMHADSRAKIIVMGDFNDNPVSASLAQILEVGCDLDSVRIEGFYNPMCNIFKRDGGTLAYEDTWNLFDQIIFSASFLSKKQQGLYFSEARIFNKDFLITHTGRYKGYPHRTYSGKYYIHGYSDHFPVYAVLLKEDGNIK